MDLAKQVVDKALELGYEGCGIIKVDAMAGYDEKLEQRLRQVPETPQKQAQYFGAVHFREDFPWAKSIVVCTWRYSRYRWAESLDGKVAKYYQMDGRRDENAPVYKASLALEGAMRELGLTVATERLYGLVPLRWAAEQAGLGRIRRNNFFYTQSGSYAYLEVFLIDQELEYRQQDSTKPCPENCTRCVDACPTRSLSAPYVMDRAACVSCFTSFEGDDMVHSPYSPHTKDWIFGCDDCQDACPFNQKAWSGEEVFPGLAEVASQVSLEGILAMSDDELRRQLNPKFWYIGKKRIHKWKLNALNAMKNDWKEDYRASANAALHDEDEPVRQMARWVLDSV